jgi:hypothetical protein|tara:strand:- start:591 stop:725 length:135 start_codon:yes stop_codon:yes gene_type:complete
MNLKISIWLSLELASSMQLDNSIAGYKIISYQKIAGIKLYLLDK